jgi:hypothetical protein
MIHHSGSAGKRVEKATLKRVQRPEFPLYDYAALRQLDESLNFSEADLAGVGGVRPSLIFGL